MGVAPLPVSRHGHDIVVIGASAGGIDSLQKLVAVLPADLPAAIFVVVHIGEHISYLDNVLAQKSKLPVSRAQNGELIRNGRIFIAPPDRHLLLHDEHLLLRRGPQENRTRPAIDPLFRTAACTFGGRTIGVIMSGGLNDGTAGLSAIKACGGVTVIQDPDDAQVPDMPSSALRYVQIDHMAPAAELGPLLIRLVTEPAGATPAIPLQMRIESAIAIQEKDRMDTMDQLGARCRFTCPECHGTLWEISEGSMLRYRCHVGHAFTAETMLTAQAAEMEGILWRLLRSAEENGAMARRFAEGERERQNQPMALQWERQARRYEQDAALARQMLKEQDIVGEGDSDQWEIEQSSSG